MKKILLALTLAPALASASVIDWSTRPGPLQTLVGGPDGTYTSGNDFANFRFTESGSGFAAPGLRDPFVYKGPFPVTVLSSVAHFNAGRAGSPTVQFDLEFTRSVRDVSFTLFNIDKDFKPQDTGFGADQITFKTPGLSIVTGADNKLVGNTVIGTGDTGHHPTDDPAGRVEVASGGLPLKQIVFDWTRSPSDNGFLDEVALGNISFTPTPVPEVGQLVLGLGAALLGAFVLGRKNSTLSTWAFKGSGRKFLT